MSDLIIPNILAQYKTATQMNELLAGIFTETGKVSIENLYNFLNLDDANGLWLDQIGLYLNYQRPYVVSSMTFISDSSLMDNPNYLLDVGDVPANDDLYKILLKSLIKQRNSNFTLESVITNLKDVLGDVNVYIGESDKMVEIFILTTDTKIVDLVSLLASIGYDWIGLPTGVILKQIKVIETSLNIFINDFSLMDDDTEVLT